MYKSVLVIFTTVVLLHVTSVLYATKPNYGNPLIITDPDFRVHNIPKKSENLEIRDIKYTSFPHCLVRKIIRRCTSLKRLGFINNGMTKYEIKDSSFLVQSSITQLDLTGNVLQYNCDLLRLMKLFKRANKQLIGDMLTGNIGKCD